MATVSYLDANAKKKATKKGMDKELKETLLEQKSTFEKFRRLCDTKEWEECRDFIKDEIYKGLSLSPGEPGVGDWWLKYSWGLKCFIERVEAHAKKYDEAIKELSK